MKLPAALLPMASPLKTAPETWAAGWASCEGEGGGTAGFQPVIWPDSAAKMKIAFPLALVGSIVGEFIGGNTGVGYLVLSGQLQIDTPLVFAALLSITILATVGTGAIGLFERLFLPWRPSLRQQSNWALG